MFNLVLTDSGRVVLAAEKEVKGTVLQTIEAMDWFDARQYVDTTDLWRDPGYGWFVR